MRIGRQGAFRGLFSFPAVIAALAAVALIGTARGQSQGDPGVGGSAFPPGTGVGGSVGGPAGSTGAGACAMKTAATPPPSDGHGLIYDAARDVTLLLTGTTRPGDSGPAVLYELSFAGGGSPVWSRYTMIGQQPQPSSRFAPGFAYDYKTGRAVLFGGNAALPDSQQPRDVWEWDGCRWMNRTPAWAPTAGWPAAAGVWPSSRWAPAMTYDWARERVILTTGIQNPNFQWETDPADATVFEWDSAAGTFTVRTPAGQPPTDRGGAIAIGDRNRKLVYLVTGLQENDSPSSAWDTSLYVWNGAAGTWARRTPSPTPSAREFAGIYHDLAADRIAVMGGTWYHWLWTPEYWHYNPDANTFSMLVADPPEYTPASGFAEMNRFWSPIAYDDRRNVAVRYGGRRAPQTPCFFDCLGDMLSDTTLIGSGGARVDFVVPPGPPDGGAPPDGGPLGPRLVNIAVNTSCPSGFPSPLESDEGWGGGALPCDVVDNQLSYDTWARGLAFTGGHSTAAGGAPYNEPAGPRHAVIDFGAARTFQKVTMWWHGVEYTPDTATLEYWNGATWVGIAPFARTYGARHEDGTNSGYADSDDYTFAPVTGSKFRYTFDNSGHNVLGTWNIHGWLYEIQVWSASGASTGPGAPCVQASACASGFCVDGVCCESACGGGDPNDCQACTIAAGAQVDGICNPVAATRVCRPAVDTCDFPEHCTGAHVACPIDITECIPLPVGDPLGTPCGMDFTCESGFCVDGVCCENACGGGLTSDCLACSAAAGGPSDGLCGSAVAGTVCRPSEGTCDVADSCDGFGLDCPANVFAGPGTVCAVSTNLCVQDALCTGVTDFCPTPAVLPPAICAPVPACVSGTCGDVDIRGGDDTVGGITLRFPGGVETAGDVTADTCVATAPPPTGYQIAVGQTGHFCWDIETTADYVTPPPPIQVCIHYPQPAIECPCPGNPIPTCSMTSTVPECRYRLAHDDGAGYTMVQDFRLDTVNNRICGGVNSLSPFIVVVPSDLNGPTFANVPGDAIAHATSTAGATVSYAAPTATDAVDGARPVICAPASGSTFAPGKTTVTCTASDSSDNVATATFTVWVQYQAPADGTFFLKPIRPDGSARFKIGRAVPVKFQLAGASAGITDLVAKLTVTRISNAVRGTVDSDGDEDGEDTDMLFRYRKAKGLYGYRWKTRGEAQGTYRLRADLGDEVPHEIDVSLKTAK